MSTRHRSAVTRLAVSVLALLPAATIAHHPLAELYDRNSLISLSGTIIETQWVNPHARFSMDVVSQTGESVRWLIEMDPPTYLDRSGIDRATFAPGSAVTVVGYQALDCQKHTEARTITFADGKVIEVTTDSSWNWRRAGEPEGPEPQAADCD